MTYNSKGMKPDQQRRFCRFLGMIQSNAENSENFVQKAVLLRKLTQQKSYFIWITKHQKCFKELQ